MQKCMTEQKKRLSKSQYYKRKCEEMIQIINKRLGVPIIQGGMGVGVSLGNLAGNVALCDGMGVISSVNAGYREKDFSTNPINANLRALSNEIKKAFSIAKGRGLVAVNIMTAVSHYEETVKTSVEAGADAVISGAGLPLDLPKYTLGSDTLVAPIVSSGKAAMVICKMWDKRYNVIPDFIVIEGSMAGGHLGFSRKELDEGTTKPLIDILKDVLITIKPFEEKYGRKIPLFAAGGVFDGNDMKKLTDAGATGVQIATRFIATEECDASVEFKNMIVKANSNEAQIINSPVGMPGRALRTNLIKKIEDGFKFLPKKCNACLKACPHNADIPYCISRALIEAVKGNTEEGLFFCGSNVGRINEIVKVETLMNEILTEWRDA